MWNDVTERPSYQFTDKQRMKDFSTNSMLERSNLASNELRRKLNKFGGSMLSERMTPKQAEIRREANTSKTHRPTSTDI